MRDSTYKRLRREMLADLDEMLQTRAKIPWELKTGSESQFEYTTAHMAEVLMTKYKPIFTTRMENGKYSLHKMRRIFIMEIRQRAAMLNRNYPAQIAGFRPIVKEPGQPRPRHISPDEMQRWFRLVRNVDTLTRRQRIEIAVNVGVPETLAEQIP